MPRLEDIQGNRYRDDAVGAPYHDVDNQPKIDYAINTLTPLVKLLIQIGELATHGASILGGLETDNDINMHVGTLTPNQIILHVSELQRTLEKRKLVQSDVLANVDALANEDVWLPFGERSDRNGKLQLTSNFASAVGSAMRAAQNIIDAIQQPQMQGQGQGQATDDMDVGDDRSDDITGPFGLMVKLDKDSAQCVFVYDERRTPPFRQAQFDEEYRVSMLGFLTPHGIIHDLRMGEDYNITDDGILRLNSHNVKKVSFRLTAASRDNPRVTFSFSNYGHTLPFSREGVTGQLHIYVPVSQQNVVIPISYHSDYVDVQLPGVATSQLPPVVSINPSQMIEQFAGDLRNVHLHADLRVPQSPLEQLVSARVNFAQITEPICAILDNLVIITSGLGNSVGEKYALKIPYLYCINMQEMTCTKTRILKHDLQVSLFDNDKFNELNVQTNIETHLIRYTLFQMMLTYRKFTWDDFKSCPQYCVMFDLYLRRGAGSVGYHYDLTPGTIVSSVGLLYSMPHDDVMMGAQLIPLKYRTDQHRSSTNVKSFNPLVVRNTALLFNNAVWTHSTPAVNNIMSRMEHKVGYEVRDNAHKIIYDSELNVTYNPIEFPESIRAKIKRSSENPSRTFLRSWHVVAISESQQSNLGVTANVVFPKYTFEELAMITMRDECFVWMHGSNCMCIEVGVNLETGEINPPGKLPGHHGGKIMPSNSARSALAPSLAPSKLSKSKTHAYSSYKKISFGRRSSTTSVSHLKKQISSKLKQLRAVFENPEKNVVVMAGKPRRTRSHSHTKISRKSSASKYTRKVRSV